MMSSQWPLRNGSAALMLAPASKAKVRNHMSALFSHCIRHELYSKLNPITPVRQSAVRQRDPDILTLEEMRSIINNIKPAAIKMMVAVASASALRRSEVRGLKWADLDLDKCLVQSSTRLRLQVGDEDEDEGIPQGNGDASGFGCSLAGLA